MQSNTVTPPSATPPLGLFAIAIGALIVGVLTLLVILGGVVATRHVGADPGAVVLALLWAALFVPVIVVAVLDIKQGCRR